MNRGRYMLGDTVTLAAWTRNAAGAPTLPEVAPLLRVYNASEHVFSAKMPIVDRPGVTGLFQYPLFLDSRFATGPHQALILFTVAGVPLLQQEAFEIVPGGHPEGHGVALYFFRYPGSDQLLLQTEAGRILRKRNPRVT